MGRDPLFKQSEAETERLAADKQAMTYATWVMLLKFATGLIALALIAAIWIVWRAG